MFETPAWQSIQLAWEEADDANDVAATGRASARPRARRSRVLDVPCGTGRIARLSRTGGSRSSGIDAIEAFLAGGTGRRASP